MRRQQITPSQWEAAQKYGPTAAEAVEAKLTRLDPTTRGWAKEISPCFAQMCKSGFVDMPAINDWLDEADRPVNVFDFLAWARKQ